MNDSGERRKSPFVSPHAKLLRWSLSDDMKSCFEGGLGPAFINSRPYNFPFHALYYLYHISEKNTHRLPPFRIPLLACHRYTVCALLNEKAGAAVVIKARESGKCFVTFWVYKGKEKKNFDGFPSQNLFFFSSDVNIWCFRRFNEDIKANIFGENGKLLETLAPTGENSHFSYEHFITFNWNNSSSRGTNKRRRIN